MTELTGLLLQHWTDCPPFLRNMEPLEWHTQAYECYAASDIVTELICNL